MKKCALLCAVAMTVMSGTAHALVVNGGFDDRTGGMYYSNGAGGTMAGVDIADVDTTSPNWFVFDEIMGWKKTKDSAGIEIQTDGVVAPAASDPFYVELDSHGTNSNSGMFQDLELGVGVYDLSFLYRARVDDKKGTNGIAVNLTGRGGAVVDSALPDVVKSKDTTQWVLQEYRFEVETAGTVRLKFSARGTEDTLGGFIDDVSISAVPLPAGVLLMGSALAGLGVASRRRRKST